MEKGCRRAGPAPVRPTRVVTQRIEGLFPQRTVTKISVWACHNRPLLPDSNRGIRPCGLRRNKAADKEVSILGGIEPAVHVPARFESGEYLLTHRDPPDGRSELW